MVTAKGLELTANEMAKSTIIKIKRQDTPNSKPYWDEFELPYKPGRNVISALMGDQFISSAK